MRFTAVVTAGALGFFALSAATPDAYAKDVAKGAAAKAPKKTAIGACVKYAQSADEDQHKLTFHIDNQCAVEVRCALSWDVKCVAENGHTSTHHTDGGEIHPGDAASYEASAADCQPGDGYEISRPTWSCSATTANVAAAAPSAE